MLSTRIGADNDYPIAQLNIGHWYYVVNTYSVSGNQTVINSYFADLTEGTALQHLIADLVASGTYGAGNSLGIGVLRQADAVMQYAQSALIDEMVFYGSVLDGATISNHFAQLLQPPPTVEYREIFPGDRNVSGNFFLPQEGWKAHFTEDGTHSTWPVIVLTGGTAFDEDLPAVASFPQDTGVTNGYLNNHSGATTNNYLYWTDEMTNRVEVAWLKQVEFDAKCNRAYLLRVALCVNTNETPDTATNNAWFVSVDFDGVVGTSGLPIPSSSATWRRHWADIGGLEWAELDFVPGDRLLVGDTKVSLPTNGLITAFGIFQDEHVSTSNMRLDNVTLYTRHVYPPPPPRGTVLMVQ